MHHAAHQRQRRQQADEEEEDGPGLPDAIKLGLGDFIFYSVLVGRAAMYDLLTATAAYLAIVAGASTTSVTAILWCRFACCQLA